MSAVAANTKPAKKPGKRTAKPYRDMARQEPAETPHDPETGEVIEAAGFDPDAWLDGLEAALAVCKDQETLDEVWNSDAQPSIERGIVFPPDRQKAENMFQKHMERIEHGK